MGVKKRHVPCMAKRWCVVVRRGAVECELHDAVKVTSVVAISTTAFPKIVGRLRSSARRGIQDVAFLVTIFLRFLYILLRPQQKILFKLQKVVFKFCDFRVTVGITNF